MPEFAYDKKDPKQVLKNGETLRVTLSMMDSKSIAEAARLYLGADYDAAGKTAADVRLAVVRQRLGDAAVAGRSDDYIAACFDTLAAMARPGAHSVAVGDHRAEATVARDEMVRRITDGWMESAATPQHRDAQSTADADVGLSPYEAYVARLTRGE